MYISYGCLLLCISFMPAWLKGSSGINTQENNLYNYYHDLPLCINNKSKAILENIPLS